ncbi:type I-E CRISPR-associated protein Cas5/CasD [Pseudoclavibacter caeni]|jgi:CRISPR system Cascade subunit CasD|uniref:Type I-E CRISPR-associated protein Cas5/CasD n=1 Tax=Pseudoclavibacter caeni TaxID=908846 RepID=A0A7C8FU52_9MICO|nr:type I-E CRISPR-associated protein Cas5/CasD [Pseudoclavibacter caeni]KAB1633732.1 type I-E CRISPR-associated protein Cas5/CasD [Pseudoclavibacter caeni]NYJ96240.1 CRISPR system Cascade subunit CasD [Pseudoclavibacter caeni]
MSVTHSLVLYLAAPMQSWGVGSRFRSRETEPMPTKSGIVGLLANALGRGRRDPVDDLATLELAVRQEQPGTLLQDYQTARDLDGGGKTRLSTRHYLVDARFLVAIGGEQHALESLAEALRRPARPLYLGRRSCPANWDLLDEHEHDGVAGGHAVRPGDPRTVLEQAAWRAASRVRQTLPKTVRLPLLVDARRGETGDILHDAPLSFDPQHRDYRDRAVTRLAVTMDNPEGRSDRDEESDADAIADEGLVTDPFLEEVRNA